MTVLAALCLSGCAVATPLCDQAAVLAERGQLAEATELYARAQQTEEGSCADTGLRTSGAAYAEAFTETSRGARAELAGETGTAGVAYQNALRIDTANAAARAGLSRLGQDAPRVPATVITVPTTPPAPWWETLWPLLLAALLVIAVCGGAVYLVDSRSRRATAAATASVEEARKARSGYDDALDELREQTDALGTKADALGEKTDELRRKTGELGTKTGELRRQTEAQHARAEQLERRVTSAESARTADQEEADRHRTRDDTVDTLGATVQALTAELEAVRWRLATSVAALAEQGAGPRGAAPPTTNGSRPGDGNGAGPSPGGEADAAPAAPELALPVQAVWELEGDAPAAESEAEVEDDAVTVVVVRCAGVQVGDDARQVNLFEYRIDEPRIDFAEVLGRREVAEALQELAAAPDDPDAQGAAATALRQQSLELRGQTEKDVTRSMGGLPTDTEARFWGALDRTVIVRSSRGVQVGDGGRQRNHVTYTVSPQMESFALLADAPAIVDALLETVRTHGSAQAVSALRDTVAERLCHAVEDVAGTLSHRGLQRTPEPGEILVVRRVEGAQLGRGGVQRNDVEVSPRTLGVVAPRADPESAGPPPTRLEPAGPDPARPEPSRSGPTPSEPAREGRTVPRARDGRSPETSGRAPRASEQEQVPTAPTAEAKAPRRGPGAPGISR